MKLSVLVPAYNEENTIKSVLKTLTEVKLISGFSIEVVVVNDCSKDNTEKQILDFQVENPQVDLKYFKHEINQGKGGAIHTAIKNATGDYLIVQDADLEYDPHEFNILLAPIVKGMADVVYGSRFMGGNPHRILFFWHSIGNKILTFLSNAATNLNLTDMETCYKVFKTSVIQGIELKEKRFGFEPEITAKIARIKGIRIYEVGVSYYGRTYEEGKKIGWRDGFRAIYCIFKYGFLKQ